jgi:hypothetical protein
VRGSEQTIGNFKFRHPLCVGYIKNGGSGFKSVGDKWDKVKI